MAKKIMEQGAEIDKSRAAIVQALKACKQQEQRLTKQGVQIGSIHFKTDRKKPTMYVREPVKDGERPYVHVGTDTDKQDEMEKRVERWAQRDRLQKDIKHLEQTLEDLDRHIKHLVSSIQSVEESAIKIRKNHISQEK